MFNPRGGFPLARRLYFCWWPLGWWRQDIRVRIALLYQNKTTLFSYSNNNEGNLMYARVISKARSLWLPANNNAIILLSQRIYRPMFFLRWISREWDSSRSPLTNNKKQKCLCLLFFVCLFVFLFFEVRVVFENAVTKRGLVLELFTPSRGLAKPISSFSCDVTAAWLVIW